MLKRAAKFAKRVRSKMRYVEFNRETSFDGMAEYSQRGMPFSMKQKSHKNGIATKLENDL